MTASNESRLTVWRDSVCMADDCDAPHELVLPVVDDESLRGVVGGLLKASYLAAIAGGRATWILETGGQEARPLAVLAQQWRHPRFLVEPDAAVTAYVGPSTVPHLYLKYWCQVNPERVFGCLQRGEPLPDRYGRAPAGGSGS